MIGPRSTELVAEATLALRLECTVEELIRTIHAHPTMSEAVGEAAHAAHGAAIHACQLQLSSADVRRSCARAGQLEPRAMAYQRRDAPDGRVDRRRHHRPLDQEGRRRRRPRRAAVRDLDRQGRRGDSRRRRRRADRDQGQGRGDGPGQQRRRGDRRRRREGCGSRGRRQRRQAGGHGRRLPRAARGRVGAPSRPGDRSAGERRRRPTATPSPTSCAGSGRRRSCAGSRSEHNVDIAQINGTGISGRVTKQDILGFIESAAPGAAPRRRRPAAPAHVPGVHSRARASRSCR